MVAYLAALKLVPWDDVIDAAPQIMSGASRLFSWIGVTRKTPKRVELEQATVDIVSLARTVHLLEGSIAELDEQLRASALHVKQLAEANVALIGMIGKHRIWLMALSLTTLLSLSVAIIFLYRTFT